MSLAADQRAARRAIAADERRRARAAAIGAEVERQSAARREIWALCMALLWSSVAVCAAMEYIESEAFNYRGDDA